ncbi:MAG: hypothetical protein P0Y64_02055 [Candidatus Sphingomonas colombiensis]|nr:hypothetical protein [Sphingomonas sp.]WEK43639.1 MAG: hypothetical protein P0Y64_02055 [Sphingomonas sp.]
MSLSERNYRRWRSVQVSRAFKSLFRPAGIVDAGRRVIGAIALLGVFLLGGRQAWRRWLYRIAFTVDGETLRLAANHVLADLRDFSFARTSAFDPDPIIMARRQGRRDVWLRIANYLELDETAVQKLMEIDDGI